MPRITDTPQCSVSYGHDQPDRFLLTIRKPMVRGYTTHVQNVPPHAVRLQPKQIGPAVSSSLHRAYRITATRRSWCAACMPCTTAEMQGKREDLLQFSW